MHLEHGSMDWLVQRASFHVEVHQACCPVDVGAAQHELAGAYPRLAERVKTRQQCKGGT